jgi:hypothetical protein
MGETESVDEDGLYVGVLLVEEGEMYFLVENRSKTRLFTFIDPGNMDDWTTTYEIKVTDEFSNKYNVTGLKFRGVKDGPYDLRPGDYWIFGEPINGPVDRATRLYVEFPSRMVKSKGKFTFQIPITRESLTFTPPQGYWRKDGEAPDGKVTRTVLFKRPDFETWFSKGNKKRR